MVVISFTVQSLGFNPQNQQKLGEKVATCTFQVEQTYKMYQKTRQKQKHVRRLYTLNWKSLAIEMFPGRVKLKRFIAQNILIVKMNNKYYHRSFEPKKNI